ncbi:PKD domain-containing protein [Candidatus Woesearchaeota archaeon]|nr:PKD domain-containing protein [Candidatus Woesearchaeota archaeon]
MSLNKRIISWMLVLSLIIISIFFVSSEYTAGSFSNLTIWDSADENMPYANKTTYSGNITTLFADYINASSGEKIISSQTCKIKFDLDYKNMSFNQDINYYTYNISFNESGNHTYTINCYKENFDNLTLVDAIAVSEIITDNDGDGYPPGTDCNDNNPDINPGMQEILYNGADDDCNSATLDYILFDITANKQTYALGELVILTLYSIDNSDTYVTINSPSNVSYIYIFMNETYPLTQEFIYTNNSGLYSVEAINYYKNYTNSKIIDFDVQNNLQLNVQANDTTIFKSESVKFTASVTGGIPPYTYEWNFDDSTTSGEQNPVHKFTQLKEHNVILKVTDFQYNQKIQTIKIKVIPEYVLKIKVEDNITSEEIEDAKVRLGDDYEYTNTTGGVEFRATNTTYDLKITASGYKTHREDIKLNQSHELIIKLQPDEDEFPPLLSLTEPINNSNISSEKVVFRFYVIDDDSVNCTLYTSHGDGWWSSEKEFTNINSDDDIRYEKSNLNSGDYYWRIECIDEDKNEVQSNNYKFTIIREESILQNELNEQENQDVNETSSYVQEIYNLLPDFNTYSPEQKKIVELLNINELIKSKKFELDKANSDLFNLRYRNDVINIMEERDKILDRINEIKNTTPRAINVLKKAEFVKYVDDEDAASLLEEYIGLKHMDYSNREKNKFIESNKLLQKKTTINTGAYNVEIEYITGWKKEITLITKKVDYDSYDNINFVEFIPKDIVESSNEVTILNKEAIILKNDPVFELALDNINDITYYFNKKVSLDIVPQIKSLVVSTDLDNAENGMGSITGFALFDKIGMSFKNKTVFIIEILVIIILSAVYINYQFRYSQSDNEKKGGSAMPVSGHVAQPVPVTQPGPAVQQKYTQPKRQVQQNYEYVSLLINEINELIHKKNLESAALKYSEINLLFNKLSDYHKNILFNRIFALGEQINMNYTLELVDKCYIALANNPGSFELAYNELQEEYIKLSHEQKQRVYPEICKLLSIISRKNEA